VGACAGVPVDVDVGFGGVGVALLIGVSVGLEVAVADGVGLGMGVGVEIGVRLGADVAVSTGQSHLAGQYLKKTVWVPASPQALDLGAVSAHSPMYRRYAGSDIDRHSQISMRRGGRLLISRDEPLRVEWFVQTVSRHLDLKPLRDQTLKE
jgi:hypothetical protein